MITNNWIKTSEKLPIINDKVLFFCIRDKCYKNIYMGYRTHEGWNIYLPYHSFELKNHANNVTHWMELPKFPGELNYNTCCKQCNEEWEDCECKK